GRGSPGGGGRRGELAVAACGSRRAGFGVVPPAGGALAARLPFGHGCFDLVFCAHSLGRLVDHLGALAEMVRVTRSGGWLAVLESDPVHRILLRWDPNLEVRVRRAQLEGLMQLARRHGM